MFKCPQLRALFMPTDLVGKANSNGVEHLTQELDIRTNTTI